MQNATTSPSSCYIGASKFLVLNNAATSEWHAMQVYFGIHFTMWNEHSSLSLCMSHLALCNFYKRLNEHGNILLLWPIACTFRFQFYSFASHVDWVPGRQWKLLSARRVQAHKSCPCHHAQGGECMKVCDARNKSARSFLCYLRILRHASGVKCGGNTKNSKLWTQ